MRKQLTLISVFVFGIYSILLGKIIETKHFCEINKYVTPKTLVILDIDDTLLIPTQTLGTDVWFLYRVKQYESQGFCYPDALQKTLAEWEAIRHLTNVKLVETGTNEIIQGLQKKNIMVMGLTTQGLALATRTVMQLRSLNIDLSLTAPSKEDHYFINQHGVLFRQGILFTSGTAKGKALLTFLDKINVHPQHVVFINDKATHLKDVEEAAKANSIDFIGLRYSYSDERIAHFCKEIAEIQWNFSTFSHLISDEEAAQLLNVKMTKN